MKQILAFNWDQCFARLCDSLLIRIFGVVVFGIILGHVTATQRPFLTISGSFIFAGLVTLLFLLKNKATFIALLFALAPFTGLIKVFGDFKEFPLILDFLLISVIIHAILQKILSAHSLKIKMPFLSWLIITFLIIAFLGIFNTNQPNLIRGIYGFRASGTFYMISFFAALLTINSKEDILKIMKVFIICGSIVAIYGIYQFFNPSIPEMTYVARGEEWYGWSPFMKPFSTMIGPFHFGIFMALSSLTVLTFLLSERDKLKINKSILGILFLVIFSVLFLSLARSAYLMVAVGAIFLIFKKTKKLRFILRLSILMIIVITVFRITPQLQVVLFRMSTLTGKTDSALQSRLRAWPEKVKFIIENPSGHGIGLTGGEANLLERADNQFLTIGIEAGWAGLFIFILIILSLLKKEMKLLKVKEPFLQMSGLWVTAVTLGLLSVMMTNQILEAYPINMYFWFMIGILYKLNYLEKKELVCQKLN